MGNDSLSKRLLALSAAKDSELYEATKEARHLLAKYPTNIQAVHVLAMLFIKSSMYDLAIPLLLQTLKYFPGNVTLKLQASFAYRKLRSYGESLKIMSNIKMVGQLTKEIHLEFAHIHTNLGDLEQARFHYQRLITHFPDDANYEIAFSELARSPVEVQSALLSIEKLLQGNKLTKYSRTHALFTKAELHLIAGNRDRAFTLFAEANQSVGINELQDPGTHDWFQCYKLLYSSKYRDKLHTFAGIDCPELFIIGMSRSGKSTLETVLTQLTSVQPGGERVALANYLHHHLGVRNLIDVMNYLQHLTPKRAEADARRYLEWIGLQNLPEGKQISNTLPGSLHLLGVISAWFPRAKLIFMDRNYLDCGLACFFKNYGHGSTSQAYTNSLVTLGHEMAYRKALTDLFEATLPNPLVRVNYEQFVEKPQNVLMSVIATLGLKRKNSETSMGGESGILPLPHQTFEGLTTLTNAFIGWSDPYVKYLDPLKDSYFNFTGERIL